MSVDLAEAHQFLEALTGSASSRVTFQTFDDDEKRKTRTLARIFQGTLEEHAGALAELNAHGAGIFVTVNETDLKGRKAENVTRIRAHFVDADGPMRRPFVVPPSHRVVSSPGREHGYFLANGDGTLEGFPKVQAQLAAFYGTDPVVKDLPRVMRVPGFFNRKHEPFLVRFIPGTGARYSVADLVAAHPVKKVTREEKLLGIAREAASGRDWSEGHRHESTKATATHARKLGLPSDGVRAVVLEFAVAAGLPESEIDKLIGWTLSKVAPDPAETAPRGLTREAVRKVQDDLARSKDGPYSVDRGLTFVEDGQNGRKLLARFAARITDEVTIDDGVESRLVYTIEAEVPGGRRLKALTVPAATFGSLLWTSEWGTAAIVSAGQSAKDKLREAIQRLSTPTFATEFAHTGWRKTESGWNYLHAGGAITAAGLKEDVGVDLPDRLATFRLPAPPEGEAERVAVRSALDATFASAAPELVVPLWATVYRAVLNEAARAPLSVFIVGRTGRRKTSIATALLNHLYPGLDAENVTSGWESTANGIEALLFAAKDAPLLLDEFVPPADPREATRLQVMAERTFRAAANGTSRTRMTVDMKPRRAFPPRATIIATGEGLPAGASVRARMFVLEVGPDDVPVRSLSQLQAVAERGDLALAMSGFLRVTAGRMDHLRATLKSRVVEVRARFAGRFAHPRTAEIVAHLLVAGEEVLRYAESIGALSKAEAAARLRFVTDALVTAGQAQGATLREEDPEERFLAALFDGQAAGRFTLAAFGQETTAKEIVGWIDEQADQLLLLPDAAYAAVNSLLREQGRTVGLSAERLWRAMADREVLVDRDPGRFTARRKVSGYRTERVRVVVLSLSGARNLSPPVLCGTGPVQVEEPEEIAL